MKMAECAVPIDRGWAWIITIASCGLLGVVIGGYRSQGIIMVEMQEMYPDESVKKILWLLSMPYLFSKLSAPLNGMILTKTSHRTLGLMGVTLMSTCLVACAYVQRLEYMYPLYGVGYGVGGGMVTLTSFTAYAPYFDKRTALSLGITASGPGIMTMILPAVLRVLFDNYSFSGAMLLYAGLCLQMFVLACFLRPISFYQRLAKQHLSAKNHTSPETKRGLTNELREESVSVEATDLKTTHLLLKSRSVPNIASEYAHRSENSKNQDSFTKALSIQELAASNLRYLQQLTDKSVSEEQTERVSKQSINWRLVYDLRCLLFGLATLSYFSGLGLTYQCIPPLGKQAGVSKAFITTALAGAGGTEIVMRIFHGWFADKKWISSYVHLTLCMSITGLTALLCAVISSQAGIILMLIGSSSTGTSVINLIPIVNGELLGKENLYSAISINYFYQGLALIVSTFSAGGIYEATQKWENVFFFISSSNLLGALIMIITIVVNNYMNRRAASINVENEGDLER